MSARSAPAAVVLAGGGSRRMGSDKALLDWHGQPLLGRVCGVLRRICDPLVVVHAAGQQLPPLADAELVRDPHPDRGPLEGIAAGLAAVDGRREAAFVCATDLPQLHPQFVLALVDLLDDDVDAVMPVADGRDQPLAAVYRPGLWARAQALLDAGERRAWVLADGARLRRVEAAGLPQPSSLRNLNTAEDYAAARAEPAPQVAVSIGGAAVTVRAATLAAAASAVPALAAALSGGTLRLNGAAVDTADTPLVEGDRLQAT